MQKYQILKPEISLPSRINTFQIRMVIRWLTEYAHMFLVLAI